MQRISYLTLSEFTRSCLTQLGCSERVSSDVDRALGHASLCGVDSHGYRLLPHYCKAIKGGRIKAKAETEINQLMPAVIEVNANDGLGHHAMYCAVNAIKEPALINGLACALVVNSSHFGSAGAYAVSGADQGLITLVTCNSDSLVPLFDGQKAFHGTNPIALAAPVPDSKPYLFDMATSAVPVNRVYAAREKKEMLPPNVALDPNGEITRDPFNAVSVAPVGADQGFKGAGLAGVADILSALLTGMGTSDQLLPMTNASDWSTPRGLGQFVLMLRTDSRLSSQVFGENLNSYLKRLRSSPAKKGKKVLAPGDREWSVKEERSRNGIPVPRSVYDVFKELAFSLEIGFHL